MSNKTKTLQTNIRTTVEQRKKLHTVSDEFNVSISDICLGGLDELYALTTSMIGLNRRTVHWVNRYFDTGLPLFLMMAQDEHSRDFRSENDCVPQYAGIMDAVLPPTIGDYGTTRETYELQLERTMRQWMEVVLREDSAIRNLTSNDDTIELWTAQGHHP